MILTRTFKDISIIILTVIIATLLIWLPHYLQINSFYHFNFSRGFDTIYQNFDGLEYVIIAKSFYDPSEIAKIAQPLPASYFPAHFPGFSLLMIPFASVIGYLKSMLLVSVLFTMFSAIAFYFLVRDFKLTSHPLWLSIVFLFLPARWLIVHSVGSAETVFAFFTIVAIYFFLKFEESRKISLLTFAAIAASFAQLTRPPGILLFAALGIYLLIRLIQELQPHNTLKVIKGYLPYLVLLMVPATLSGLFYWFFLSMGDFWAYFHTGDNIHLMFPPYQVFNKDQFWVGDIWLEDIVYLLLFGFIAAFRLLKTNLIPVGVYMLVFLTAAILIAHRDISRYILPIAPFVLIAFERVITSKEFKWAFLVLLLGIYLYSQNFILSNTAPISNLIDYN